ncbi:MAG: GNAT family N-acetyltransferase [Desulfobulbaceae bacterium]|nr:MAG: GNAT family N-acetyltransferase [Desulfobulbaceae bacterium]
MEILPLNETDLLAVRNLSAQSEGLAVDRDSFYWLFSEFFKETSFVVYTNNQLIGFILGFINQTEPTQGFIYSLGVAAKHQRKGAGTLLIQAFQERMRARGVRTLYLTTTPENSKALNFYQKIGFSKPEEFLKIEQVRLKLFKHIDEQFGKTDAA